ncbi:AMP-dependent synthetase/ligase [Chryseobacterium koreense]|uniref:AMP-dependent synthetase n=1 Tax=Chryseobacterium koreense CCUG 49689 TaxID=1304281 RepID=A0A0J7J200_9FLAO|nr:long-chain fatty acid--CoA ligase [Chryseobacterium koreense]KMQ72433.1 AMP-dependent synthetase [Chryseobacterium koreense CCUG 49689]MBB5333476.1 long-chain acyl-CoA synthetase [Chryseobacterium koreense]
MNVTHFLNSNTQKFPLKSAIGYKKKEEWKELSWANFRRMVFKTANALKTAGIVENDRVAIYSDNSAEWIIFDLAVLSLGAVTVPIYSTNNLEQAEYILADSEAKIILVGNQDQYDAAVEILNKNQVLQQIIVSKKSVWIQKEKSQYLEDFIKKCDEHFEIVEKDDEDLATIIYTSGTTGVPKGVMLTHGNFYKCFDAHFDFFKFKNFENEHSLAFLPLTHVFERSWTLLCLYGGAKVTFLENTKLIASTLTEVKPTMMCSVPRFYQKIYAGIQEMVSESTESKKKIFNWAMKVGAEVAELKRTGKSVSFSLKLKNYIANTLVFKKIKHKMGGNLWFMPCGGASISAEVTQFFDAMGIHITVGYGLTETTATLTAFPFQNYEYGTAGITLGDTKIRIGENDEIQAKGSGIMKGYYKKPAETAEVFTNDGWFKTGDAGKFDEKGNLVITDRIKDLMKTSNGKYVAPQPIENLLSNNNFITQAMVIAEGKPFVTALIIPNFEALKELLPKLNIPFTSWEEIVNTDKIKDFYHQKLDEIQKQLSGFEKVKKFVLMPAEFEITTGEITPTLKVKRNVVLAKYVDLIDKMYS